MGNPSPPFCCQQTMNTSQDYQSLLEEKGISLEPLGLLDIALERVDALHAISILQKALIPILGGDVYFKHGSGIEIAYANWHSDPKPGEESVHFVNRSCLETENYIKSFPLSDAHPIFVLVVSR